MVEAFMFEASSATYAEDESIVIAIHDRNDVRILKGTVEAAKTLALGILVEIADADENLGERLQEIGDVPRCTELTVRAPPEQVAEGRILAKRRADVQVAPSSAAGVGREKAQQNSITHAKKFSSSKNVASIAPNTDSGAREGTLPTNSAKKIREWTDRQIARWLTAWRPEVIDRPSCEEFVSTHDQARAARLASVAAEIETLLKEEQTRECDADPLLRKLCVARSG